jgi:adenylate kinase family enzyme
LPVRIAVADTFVYLDLPTWRCMVRMLGRTMIGLGRVRRDAAPGCRDHISWELIDYISTYRSTRRSAAYAALRDFPGRQVLLRDQAEIARFIDSARS